MPIQVKCANPECAKSLRVNDELAGKTIRCPACKTPVKVAGATPAMVAAAPKPAAKPTAPPPAPAAKKPAPIPAKTSPKPPPPDDEDVPTLEDFDDMPPAKSKVADKPAAKKSKQDDFDDFDDFDTFTDDPPKKGKVKKDDLDAPKKKGKKDDDYDDDYDAPKKKGKGKGKGKQDADLDDLPDTLWEDCDLFRHERLSTKCLFSIWKTKFTIFNADTEEQIGMAEEHLPTWKGWLRMFRVGPIKFANWLTVDMEIREDAKGPVLFYIRKLAAPMPWQLTSTLEILDFRKRRIGYFKTKLFSLTGGFWIYDDDDKQVAELKGKFSFTKPRMDFIDTEGEILGDVCMSIVDDKKKKKGFQIIWGNIPMVMTMKEHVEDHIPTKVLFLAATMATQIAQNASKATLG